MQVLGLSADQVSSGASLHGNIVSALIAVDSSTLSSSTLAVPLSTFPLVPAQVNKKKNDKNIYFVLESNDRHRFVDVHNLASYRTRPH